MTRSLVAYTYILECSNGAYYVGSTNDLERRIAEHQAGEGSRFTSAHLPVKLVYWEEYQNIEEAFRRERQLHGWSRAKKEALIKGDIEKLKSASTGGPSRPFDRLRDLAGPDAERVEAPVQNKRI